MNIDRISVVMPMINNRGHARHKGVIRSASLVGFICMGCVGLVMQAGLASDALVGQATTARYLVPQAGPAITLGDAFMRTPLLLLADETPAGSPSDAVDEVKAREIVGFQDDDRTTRKFLELVVLPLGVCLALILLLRRGFLN